MDASQVTLHHGDCLDALRTLPAASVDAVICDPPYGLSDIKPEAVTAALTAWAQGDREHVPDSRGFMGRSWDAFVPPPAVWDECLRVLKPGGHLLAFAGSRTADLMGLSVRMAGFEIRDTIMWVYGSGMPKGQNVGKAIDKMAGARREVVGPAKYSNRGRTVGPGPESVDREGVKPAGQYAADYVETAPATLEAARWEGWNTSLKPSQEPIIVARKPLAGTVAATVLVYGTGALNVDACRVQMSDADRAFIHKTARPNSAGQRHEGDVMNRPSAPTVNVHAAGRWPANVLLSHGACDDSSCEPGCPVAELDAQSGNLPTQKTRSTADKKYGEDHIFAFGNQRHGPTYYGEQGGASRFFPVFRYQAKAPTAERPKVDGVAHSTVKPLALMRWLVRLVTPQGGTIVDPFSGSGTTLEAALLEGFHVIGIEREADYLPLIQHRIDRARATLTAAGVEPDEPGLFDVPA